MDLEAERICDSCEENEGCVMCTTCNAWLCEECDKATHEIAGFSAHKRQRDCEAPGFCGKHHTRSTAFCEDCKELCCRRCMTDPQHRGHLFVECAAAGATYAKKRADLAETLKGAQDLGQNATSSIQAEIDALGESRQNALDAIEAAFGRLTDALEARKEKLIDIVAERADAEEERLQNIYNDLDTKCANADQSLEDFHATEESLSETGGSIGSALITASVEMERLISGITSDIRKTLAEATTKSISITFAEEGQEKDKKESTNMEGLIEAFGNISFDPKYNAKKMLCIKTKDGKMDLDDTSVGLEWEGAPVPVINIAQKCDAFVFAVDQRDPGAKEFREVWSGKETSTRCKGLIRGKRTDFRVRGCLRGANAESAIWTSNVLPAIGGGFPGIWKEGPYYKLSEDGKTAVKTDAKGSGYGIALGSIPVTEDGISKWRFVITRYVGSIACVGVAPADIDQELESAYEKVGYYICTCDAELHAGPPYKYSHKTYGRCKIDTGEFIDVVVDMIEHTISFNCKGKDCGIAYKDVPSDKPLVPAVIFHKEGEAVELLPHPDDEGPLEDAPSKLPEKSAWKACPESITDFDKMYSLDSPRKAQSGDFSGCTVIGNTPIPLGGKYSWKVRILENINDGEGDIFVGVAPEDIDQGAGENQTRCGWYIACCGGILCSGPPHSLSGTEHAPRREGGVKGGETVGITIDTTEGKISFVFNGIKRKPAYESIPLDKPLVPAAVFFCCSNRIELVI